MPASYTPLRYPGGKSRLANFVKLLLLRNDLNPVHYIEPYAGGAGLGITLLLHGFARTITINDIDPLIHAFWNSAIRDTESLCKRISATRITMREWHRQREVIENRKRHSTLDIGFATFFLNRTNRSGIIRGGVIGGKEQTGKWKINARFNKKTLIARIHAIAGLRDRIYLRNIDACDLINSRLRRNNAPVFWYLDPPYFNKGQELYENHYTHRDHAQLAEFIVDIKDPWIISYDNTPEIRKLFGRHKKLAYKVSYSAADHYGGSEVAFFSAGLRVPIVENPMGVDASLVKRRIRSYLKTHEFV